MDLLSAGRCRRPGDPETREIAPAIVFLDLAGARAEASRDARAFVCHHDCAIENRKGEGTGGHICAQLHQAIDAAVNIDGKRAARDGHGAALADLESRSPFSFISTSSSLPALR